MTTKERILEVAKIEYAKHGYAGARVLDISKAAKCNVAIIYRHYPSKLALYREALRSAQEKLGAWEWQDPITDLEQGRIKLDADALLLVRNRLDDLAKRME